jgi:chorismate mutase
MATRKRARGATAVRAIRGATTVAADEPGLVLDATRELLAEMLARNGVGEAELISAVFTVTADLTTAFPARAARELGWVDVPLLCAVEIPVPDALPRCVRVLLHVHSARPRSAIAHAYLRGASVLRPDLARVAAACESTLAAAAS